MKSVKVHIYDATVKMDAELRELLGHEEGPTNREAYRIQQWIVGKDVSEGDYRKFVDKSGDLFVGIVKDRGKPRMMMLKKSDWETLKGLDS